jgi:hypothetical protein
LAQGVADLLIRAGETLIPMDTTEVREYKKARVQRPDA